MKLKPECIPCLVERAKYECDIVFNEDREKIRALKEFTAFLSEHLTPSELKPPPFFGTERERILKRRSGVKDPHGEVKRRSNEVAKKLLFEASQFYDAASDKIEALIRIAAAANSMEYGIKGYSYSEVDFQHEFVHTLNEYLKWDRQSIRSAIENREKILYLTDNAGEIFFDAFVIRALIRMGKEVVVSPKSAPVINDATIEDLKEAGISYFEERCKIIPSGAYIGISLGEVEEEFLDVFSDERYLVVAKGMGNYETISEFEARDEFGLKGRLIYILRAKCEPVARSMGVRRGELVAKLVT
jgi:uncharacterized protein with ATP-grasp and redox domains